MKKEFVAETYPADVAEKIFNGVVCARIIGNEEEIRLTTDLYVARYPIEDYGTEAWGDAMPVAICRATLTVSYELLVFRRT